MSTSNGEELFSIGGRLREERNRIGLSQVVFGIELAATDRTVKKWEANETSPRAEDLLAASRLGVDVLYVVTGERQPPSKTHGVEEPAVAYSAAAELAKYIARLDLSETDTAMLKAFADRLAR